MPMSDNEKRAGEVALPFDPSETADDASVIFIGRIRSSWRTWAECPKNMMQARERHRLAAIEVDETCREGVVTLTG